MNETCLKSYLCHYSPLSVVDPLKDLKDTYYAILLVPALNRLLHKFKIKTLYKNFHTPQAWANKDRILTEDTVIFIFTFVFKETHRRLTHINFVDKGYTIEFSLKSTYLAFMSLVCSALVSKLMSRH